MVDPQEIIISLTAGRPFTSGATNPQMAQITDSQRRPTTVQGTFPRGEHAPSQDRHITMQGTLHQVQPAVFQGTVDATFNLGQAAPFQGGPSTASATGSPTVPPHAHVSPQNQIFGPRRHPGPSSATNSPPPTQTTQELSRRAHQRPQFFPVMARFQYEDARMAMVFASIFFMFVLASCTFNRIIIIGATAVVSPMAVYMMAQLPTEKKVVVLIGGITILGCLFLADLATRPHCLIVCKSSNSTHISLEAMVDAAKEDRVPKTCMRACLSIQAADVFSYLYEFAVANNTLA